ncbi:DUF6966 domain-containing protein [Pseudomonas sp. NPDC089734]|uniref:DUF6966 domain-containing protein n=1 Tax=Pseudomonas sp. NPDC089734 TaxID=3364469 RepID=UPI003806F231
MVLLACTLAIGNIAFRATSRRYLNMGAKTEELIRVLDELIAVLESDDEEHWSAWFRNARAQLLDSDYAGIASVLSAFGGMGSFNDLTLGRSYKNGVLCWKAGYGDLNKRLEGLKDDVSRLAGEVKKLQFA